MNKRVKDENKLKPCPFCGGYPRIAEAINNKHCIICSDCAVATLPESDMSKLFAVWNRRTEAYEFE